MPIYGLFDYDPDGLAIFHTYKYGSKSLAHDNASLTVPTMCWIGPCDRQVLGLVDELQNQGLLHMSTRDRKKAVQMLQWDLTGKESLELWWRRELQLMLMTNIKVELELLDSLPGGMVAWLKQGLA